MAQPVFAGPQANFAESYEKVLVPGLFRPCAELLLDRTRVGPGERLLDIATGTGIVARLARERVGDRGAVVAVDLSPPMLALARSLDPRIDWREGSAVSLPVPEHERFDVVICQQGLQFFPDRPAAAREMHRVLHAGGRVGAATWLPLPEATVFRDAHAIAERLLGPIADNRHAFGDGDALARLLADAGFGEVQVERVAIPVTFAEPATFARMNAMALVGMSTAGKTMTDEQKAEMAGTIATETIPILTRHQQGDRVSFELGSTLATAVKPPGRG